MSHFAKIVDDKVVEVIVADQEFIDSLPVKDGIQWIQTSYNTMAGQHKLGGTPLRKNFAGVGYTYDKQRDAFIPPQPYDAFELNEDTCQWEPPFPPPQDDNMYQWNGRINNWVLWNPTND
jgi:hypothetical protein